MKNRFVRRDFVLKSSSLAFIAIVLIGGLLFTSCSVSKNLTLSNDGITKYVIVIPDSPTIVETTAASELKEHLEQITGAEFVVLHESEVKSPHRLLIVGNSKLARSRPAPL